MADTAQPGPIGSHGHDGETRRDFLAIAATAIASVGAACAVWPLISSMNPAANQQAAYAKNVYRSVKPEILVLVGICTHLGCIPEFVPQPGGSLGASWQGGYFCPCHGSRYDLSGRVFQNVPAPYNLPVPPYHYVSDTVIRVGENPPDSTFDFNAVEQI